MGVPDLRERRYLDRGRGEIVLLVVVAAVLAVGAVFGVAWAAGLDAVRDRLIHVDVVWLPVAAAVLVPAYAGYISAYRAVTEVEGERPLEWRTTAAVVATGFGVFHVRGGLGVDLEAMHRSCSSPAVARSRVLGLGALEYAVLAPAASVAAMLVLAEGTRISWGMTLPWAICVPLGFLFGFAALRHNVRLHRRGGLAAGIAQALHGVDILRRLAFTSPRVAISAYAGMTLYWAAEVFALWAMLHAFLGHAPDLPSVIVGYATGYALTRRTLPLAGAGVVEALLPFALSWMSYPLAAAVVAVGAYRVVNLWLPLVPALAGMRAERRARLA
jgi:uncharacterized membrane protein YbhN (UPF0104 family)